VDPLVARSLLRLDRHAQHDPIGRTVVLNAPRVKRIAGRSLQAGEVLIITAGTSDMSVAEEARATAQVLG